MAHDIVAVGADAMPVSGNIVAPAGYTATQTSDDIGTLGAVALELITNFVKTGAAPSVVITIQGVIYPGGPTQPAVVWPLLVSAALVATGVSVLRVSGNALTGVANVTVQDIVPDRIRVVYTHANGDVATYSSTLILAPG
jgi:hypothetical protein